MEMFHPEANLETIHTAAIETGRGESR